jgi:5S rRNA maturation endonuclease (ribonuclease M5)
LRHIDLVKRRRDSDRKTGELFESLKKFLEELEYLVDGVLVEGSRDIDALKRLGFKGKIEACSQYCISDVDLVELLSEKMNTIAVLTDFDQEGLELNKKLSNLLEKRGVKVEAGLRREIGRLMAAIGVYAIESLDNAAHRTSNH